MKSIGYIRVSGREQVKGTSLAQQRRDIEKYCRDNRIELVRIIEDGGVTGSKDISERPGIRELLLLAGQDAFDAVVVMRLDRFSRNLYEALWCEKRLLTHGVSVVSIEQDTTGLPDEMARAFRSIMLTFAELDKDMTVKKMENGKAAKFKGGPAGPVCGRISYGYRTEGPRGARRLVPDAGEQMVILSMRRMREAGLGAGRIAACLNGAPFRGQDVTAAARGGGQWSESMVRRALTSGHSKGRVAWGGQTKKIKVSR